MLQLKRLNLEIQATDAVVKACDYAALVDAEAILHHAQAEAARVREEAQQASAEEKARGYRDGVELGKAELAEQMVATIGQSAVYFSQLEQTLVDVVIRATRRVIGEIEESERAERIVRQALALLRHEHQVRVKVPPAQRDLLLARLDRIRAAFPRIQILEIEADSRLPEDGCLLETQLGVIDARIETQLRAIEKALVRSLQ